ncbi:MAG TPA: hypothetical protein VGM76_00770 [Lacipirellulaceae bacterium]|jgi:hypothetical protein
MDAKRELLRHTLATLVYRAVKPMRDIPPRFGKMRAGEDCRSAAEIVAHMGDLLDWAFTAAQGNPVWNNSEPESFTKDAARFFAAAKSLDDYLASGAPLGCPTEKLFQGPIADALTHVGQLATLRRLAGAPVRGENYFVADIQSGRVGPDQAPPNREFD